MSIERIINDSGPVLVANPINPEHSQTVPSPVGIHIAGVGIANAADSGLENYLPFRNLSREQFQRAVTPSEFSSSESRETPPITEGCDSILGVKVYEICMKILTKCPEFEVSDIQQLNQQVSTALDKLDEHRANFGGSPAKIETPHFTIYSASKKVAYIVTTKDPLGNGQFKKFYKLIKIDGNEIETRAGLAMDKKQMGKFASMKLRIDPIRIPMQHIQPNAEFDFEDKDAQVRFLVYPLYDGNIYSLAEKESWAFDQRLFAMTESCEALIELHRGGWAHGDVKPDNFYVVGKTGLEPAQIILGDTDSVLREDEPVPKGRFIWAAGYTDAKNYQKQAGDMFAFGESLIQMFKSVVPDLHLMVLMPKEDYLVRRENLPLKIASLVELIRDLKNPDLGIRPSAIAASDRLKAISQM